MERDIIAFRRAPPSRRLLVNPHPCRPVFSTHLIHSEVACIPQTEVLIMYLAIYGHIQQYGLASCSYAMSFALHFSKDLHDPLPLFAWVWHRCVHNQVR